ncbi:hypothetical protein [Halalkalibacillus halophilus]|uniref:hypothetical protein n=1 Tax=Halalkalibacillus halophilus TaxID=392827 RepID=UPI000413D1D5|nr:hypothetical protein [Halalkalibacillus halophilus]
MNDVLQRIGIFGAFLFMVPALIGFNESGRTGSSNPLLVYILLFSLVLMMISSIWLFRKLENNRNLLIEISFYTLWISTPFLMISQFVSLLYLAEIVNPEPELLATKNFLLPIGVLSLGFPISFILLGLGCYFKSIKVGVGLLVSSFVMMLGLIIFPWIHHVGIVGVATFYIFLLIKIKKMY